MSSDQLNIKEKPPSLTTHEARWGSSALRLLSITWRRWLADRLGEASALREAFWWTCRTWLLGCWLEHVGDTYFKRDWLASGSFWTRTEKNTWIYLPCATPYDDFWCDIKLQYGEPPFIQLDWHFSMSTWGKAPESTWVGGSKGRCFTSKTSMKYVWGQSDENQFQAQKKKRDEEKNEDKNNDYSDCNGWWFRKPVGLTRTACILLKTRRRKLDPRPKRSLSCFA